MKTIEFAISSILLGIVSLSAQTVSPPSDQARLRATEDVTGVNKSGLAPDPPPSGFIAFNGKVYVVSGSKTFPLNKELTFKITPGGFIGVNGQFQSLPGGAMLSPDGQIVAAPAGLQDVNGNMVQMPLFNPTIANTTFAPFSVAPNPATVGNTSVNQNPANANPQNANQSIRSVNQNGTNANLPQNATQQGNPYDKPAQPSPATRAPSAQGGAATGGAAKAGAAGGGSGGKP